MKKKIKRVFLDIDGVMADFVTEACKVHNRPIPNFIKEENLDLSELFHMNKFEFYDKMGEQFWVKLPLIEDALKIEKLIEDKFGKEKIWFCTSPVTTYGCLEGKRQWLFANFYDYRSKFIITANKAVCAYPDTLLLDDRSKITELFIENGGNAILVPRAWNKLADENTLEYLKKELEKYE
jgi:5'(3')-deoxyribonucleotidase